MAGAKRHADLALRFYAAYPRPVAGARVDHDDPQL